MGFGKGVCQLEQAGSTCFSAISHSGPSTLPPGASTSVVEPGREESSQRFTKDPTSWRSSQGNKWRGPLGGSDSETAMAWRPAMTHSTSMGELSVEAENTKALFFPSFLFFLSFFFALSLAALRNTRAAWKHVFLIIGSSRRLEDWGENKNQDREGTGHKGKGGGYSRPPSLCPSPGLLPWQHPHPQRTSAMVATESWIWEKR